MVREFSESGLSQKEFALKVGVHPLTVARWVESCSGKLLSDGPTSTSPASPFMVAVGTKVSPAPAQIRAGRITALGSYLEYERRTDPKAKDDRFVRLAAIVRHVESSIPPQASLLASSPKRSEPQASHFHAESAESVDVGWNPVVPIVAAEDCTQPSSLSGQRLMSAGLQLRLDLSEFGSEPFAHGMSDQQEIPRSRPAADVREAKEVEGFRFARAVFCSFGSRKATKAQETGFLAVQLQTELDHSLVQ